MVRMALAILFGKLVSRIFLVGAIDELGGNLFIVTTYIKFELNI